MSEYIKREDVEKALAEILYGDSGFDPLRKKYVQEALSDLNVPSIDIVHCNECKHKEHCSGSVDMIDPWVRTGTFENVDYCSYGERKEQEHE